MASCLIQLLNTNSESAGIRVLKLRGEVSNKENKLITIKFYQNHLCYFGIAYTPNITNAHAFTVVLGEVHGPLCCGWLMTELYVSVTTSSALL